MSERLLSPSQIPSALWVTGNPRGRISLPRELCRQYRHMIYAHRLEGLAMKCRPDEEGPVGGIGKEATEKHFAARFCGSCGRVVLAVLDPHDELDQASDLFMTMFAGGRVALLDIPCGAAAATASIVTTIAELRHSRILPRIPLRVDIVGGDISDDALSLAEEMLTGLKPSLHAEGITLTWNLSNWDVTNKQMTTQLLHSWVQSAVGSARSLFVAANFSGFLANSAREKKARDQLDEMLRWAEAQHADVVWMEPQTVGATRSFLPGFLGRATGWLRGLRPSRGVESATPHAVSMAEMNHPVRATVITVRVALLRLTATSKT